MEYIEKLLNLVNNPDFLYKIFSGVLLIIFVLIMKHIIFKVVSQIEKSFVVKYKDKEDVMLTSTKTRLAMIKKIISASLYFLAIIMFLLQFKVLRTFSTGILASAGVLGIIFGMATQSVFSNIMAGVSISFSQPVRLNDAVIFNGDFGWVEDIGFVHTIIRTWDNRRIIVPNSVLVNQVIQNWTIKDSSLLGTVMLYMDYTCDIEKIREWVKYIVEKSEFSTEDKVFGAQIIDLTEKTMVVRVLAKGSDAPSTWNLRCEIREKLIKKFKENRMPLPVIRIQQEENDIGITSGNK
ncbi:mechanosensitive ion channel family protein [bacterium]